VPEDSDKGLVTLLVTRMPPEVITLVPDKVILFAPAELNRKLFVV